MPLMVAGPWESDDPILGKTTQIGILFQISTIRKVRLSHGAVVGDVSVERELPPDFYFYQRTPGDDDGSGFGSARVISHLSSSSWDGQRLQVRFQGDGPSPYFALADLALDLTFNRKQQVWTGDYTRDGVTKRVRLERPGASLKTNPSPLVGTWSFYQSERGGRISEATCVSIVQGMDGVFMAWEHSSFLGRVGTDGLPSTGIVRDSAGQRLGITAQGDAVTLDEFDYYSTHEPIRKFIGKLSADRAQIAGRLIQFGPPLGRRMVGAQAPQAQAGIEGQLAVMTRTSKGCVSRLSALQPAQQKRK
jgi:hypothetical protein